MGGRNKESCKRKLETKRHLTAIQFFFFCLDWKEKQRETEDMMTFYGG